MKFWSKKPMFNIHFSLKSNNGKLGGIPCSTSSELTCPLSCPLAKSCYAKSGPLLWHWDKVSSGKRGSDFQTFVQQIAELKPGQLWRHNQAGDLPSNDRIHIDTNALAQIAKANIGRKGFTYTHYDAENNPDNRSAIKSANDSGFTINLSANSVNHADRLTELNCAPVVTVLPLEYGPIPKSFKSPAGNTVVVCPESYNKEITCAKCKLCAWKERKAIIAFPAHGSGKNKLAEEVAEN